MSAEPLSAGFAPLTGAGTAGTGVAGAALLVALLVGVVAGRAKQRLTLLIAGLVAAVVIGFVVTATGAPPADKAGELTALYTAALPLAVSFVAGWVCAKASWLVRLLVLVAAVVLVLTFPYAAAGQATAAALVGGAR
jgi:hypothetical protein